MTTDHNALTYAAYALLACASACATVPRASEEADSVMQQSFATDRGETGAARIVPADLHRVRGTTALEAIRELRPDFLRISLRKMNESNASPAVSVYENGRYIGGVEMLSGIPLGMLVEIRRIEQVEAMILFGSKCPCDGGVILVRTRP